ncbi:MAG: SCO family protein [Pseudomonadota bacterium]
MTRVVLTLAACLVAVILGGSLSMLIFGTDTSRPYVIKGREDIGGPFTLVNHAGQPTTEAVLDGKVSLLYFGYTYCPDFCPNGLGIISDVLDRLETSGIDAQGVFISVDPKRDTPEALGEYIGSFHPKITGLTGTMEQVEAAAETWGAIFRYTEDADFPGGYLVDHTVFIDVVDANGRLIGSFPHGRTDAENVLLPERIAKAIQEQI